MSSEEDWRHLTPPDEYTDTDLTDPEAIDLDAVIGEYAESDALDDTEALSNPLADAIASADPEPTNWTPVDYRHTGVTGRGGAKKLASSAVAPLVAMARGYETVEEEGLSDAYKRYPLPRKVTAQGRRISEAVQRGDLLIMPWFTHDDVVDAEKSMKQPKPATVQIRPARPEVVVSPSGKERELKYEFVSGLGTPIGMHPAFPTSWIDNTPVVLIAEGLLKGDSALTGYLLANGCTRDDLDWTAELATGDRAADMKAARSRLAFLLDRIPEDDQVLVLTIGGVDNWKNNPEWRSIRLNNRVAWIGIDGDVATNPNVYRAASELWDFLGAKKKATPVLMAPTAAATGDADPEEKIGIDDYLADHGTWVDLVKQVTPTLPPRPQGTDVEHIGTYRMSEDGTRLEFCKPVPDPFNPNAAPVKGVWEEAVPIGGLEIGEVVVEDWVNRRREETAHTEIEVRWRPRRDPETVRTGSIIAPEHILNVTPDQWWRHGAKIPGRVLRAPAWPPSKKDGEEWLRAMKAASEGEEKRITLTLSSTGLMPLYVHDYDPEGPVLDPGENGYGPTVFVLPGRVIPDHGALDHGHGHASVSGATLPSDLARNLRLPEDLPVAFNDEEMTEYLRDAIRAYLWDGRNQFRKRSGPEGATDRAIYYAEVGQGAWVHAGNQPHGGYMVIGEPGSGKTTAMKLHATEYGSGGEYGKVIGQSEAVIGSSGVGLHNLRYRFDDYAENKHDPRKEAAACAGQEHKVRENYEPEAKKYVKVQVIGPNGRPTWALPPVDYRSACYVLQGERVPTLWRASTLERCVILVHEAADWVEGGVSRIREITEAGHVGRYTYGYMRWVCHTADSMVDDVWTARGPESARAKWQAHLGKKYATLTQALTEQQQWAPRCSEWVAHIYIGIELATQYALDVGALSREEVDAYRKEAKATLIAAMHHHINTFLPDEASGGAGLLERIHAARTSGAGRITTWTEYLSDDDENSKRGTVMGAYGIEAGGVEGTFVALNLRAVAKALGVRDTDIRADLADLAYKWREPNGKNADGTPRYKTSSTKNLGRAGRVYLVPEEVFSSTSEVTSTQYDDDF